jgi:hypothetical protein
MNEALEVLQSLSKALEAGGYNAAPSTLVQGSALQVEDLSPVMHVLTFDDKHIKLQKLLTVDSTKSLLAQFNRQLSYGQFGGSAQLEGFIGQEETSQYVRIVVPMAFYSHLRRVTLVANMVQTSDGKKAEERAASDAAKKIAADIEFDLFRGKADFIDVTGVFNGSPADIPNLPNMVGIDVQVRASDAEFNAHDAMFGEFGSDASVVIPCGSTLTQDNVEDGAVRSAMNMGNADKLLVDPLVMSNYNKITQAKERIILAGSPQDATGADLRRQWVSGGTVQIEASRFLSGKTRPNYARSNGPGTPGTTTPSLVAGTTGFLAGQIYTYYVTSGNQVGESLANAAVTATIGTSGQSVSLSIAAPGSSPTPVQYYNVYRSAAGGSAATAYFIGRVIAASTGATVFNDLGNKIPAFVTGYLLETDTFAMKELSPYSRAKLAVTDLSQPEAHFRFTCLAAMLPRRNVLFDSLR